MSSKSRVTLTEARELYVSRVQGLSIADERRRNICDEFYRKLSLEQLEQVAINHNIDVTSC